MSKSTIRTAKGDITKITFDAMIVHGVNCKGVMGSGVAKALRDKYPEVFTSYRDYYESFIDDKLSDPRDLLGNVNYVQLDMDLTVANAFTQFDYGRDGRKYVSYDSVFDAFTDVNQSLHELWDIGRGQDLYFPKIGAGLGGGNWNVIKTIIEETVDQKFNPTLVEFA